jgi:hypothetical protein
VSDDGLGSGSRAPPRWSGIDALRWLVLELGSRTRRAPRAGEMCP